MSTTFSSLPFAAVAPPASANAADVHLAVCAIAVCVSGSDDGMP